MTLPARKRLVIVATNRELATESYYRRLWIVIRNIMDIHKISRRKWVDLCIDCFRDSYRSIDFRWPNGQTYEPPEVDSFFKDPEARWLSFYLEQVDGLPKMRSEHYTRLRVFDAVIRVKWPRLAKHIRK